MSVDVALEARVTRGASVAEIEDVFRRRHRELLRVAVAIAGSVEAGEDAVQEGLARALSRRWTFRGAGPVEAWLFRVVVNAARNQRRRPLDAVSNGAAPEPRLGDEIVRAAVAALPERQRLALFLRYYADLDYDGIAHVLGVRRGTVSATLNQAHAALRRALRVEVL